MALDTCWAVQRTLLRHGIVAFRKSSSIHGSDRPRRGFLGCEFVRISQDEFVVKNNKKLIEKDCRDRPVAGAAHILDAFKNNGT